MELLLNMTIGGTITACLILLVKGLLKEKLTPKWHFYIWIILALRLLLPGLPESDFSLFNFLPETENVTAVQSEYVGSNPQGETDVYTGDDASRYIEGSVSVKSPITGIEQRRSFSVEEQKINFLMIGWLAGAVCIALYLAGSYWIFVRRIREYPVCRQSEILNVFEECKREAGISSNRVMLRLGGSTPMLLGIFRPVMLIPDEYTSTELRHVILHEFCHYKHRDTLINLICSGFLCFYWFNPVFWLSFFTIRRDLELLCDEQVIRITGNRKDYSITLLKTALKKNQFLIATSSMQNGEKEVTKRIKQISKLNKTKLWISILAVMLVLIAGFVCLTDASASGDINVEIGGGYMIRIPEEWMGTDGGDLAFTDSQGEIFGGASATVIDSGRVGKIDLESMELPLPNHSLVKERKVIRNGDEEMILINLDHDSETAAQTAERNEGGDSSPMEPIHQNYIFLCPNAITSDLYMIWADADVVSERQLIKIAKSLKACPIPQIDQQETDFKDEWIDTADVLLKRYFQNYADADLPVSSDVSGYQIDRLEQIMDDQNSWSVICPNAAVFRVDYTLKIAYPQWYSFAGGGFEIGTDQKTKIYKDQLVVFEKDNLRRTKLMGFIWPQNIGEMGQANAILHTLSYSDAAQSPESLLTLKMPYIGDHTRVGKILASLPLAGYSTGMELHTKAEPYGLTVNYDLTDLGDKVFLSRPDRKKTDSSGWDPNPYLAAQLAKNSAILLSLIDNCSTVEFKITGMSEFGVPYTYYYLADRTALQKEFGRDPRSFTVDLETFRGYLNQLEERSLEVK